MLSFKLIWMSVFLIYCVSEAWGAMPAAKRAGERDRVEEAKEAQDSKKATPPIHSVRRFTEFVKKIEGGVLYTERNQYDLTGVRVMDLTRNRNVGNPGKMPKKTAEMTFVNHQLREVVIRQRP